MGLVSQVKFEFYIIDALILYDCNLVINNKYTHDTSAPTKYDEGTAPIIITLLSEIEPTGSGL